MDRFIARENIRYFKQQLAGAPDENKKRTLTKLLADEEERLRQFEDDPPR